jgi:hypothetical protein
VGQTRRIATASALGSCTIARLEKAAMVRVIHEEPAFAEVFIAHLLGRSKLTDDDFDVVEGNRQKLAGRIQEQYGIARDEAERQVDDWLGRQ